MSIFLQVASAVLALSLIVKSGFFTPWILISAAVLLMGVRRLTSFMGMARAMLWPQQQLVPEAIALAISILMFVGLWFLSPMFGHIRERHVAELEKRDILIRESHHHVRNNLQLLQSMFSLREGSLSDTDQRNLLREMLMRVQSFALLHEQLYTRSDSESCSAYLETLLQSIKAAYPETNVRVAVDADQVQIARADLLPIGILVNEMALNSFKHAFGGIQDPLLEVSARNRLGVLEIIDGRRSSFGMEMIRTFCANPGWDLRIENRAGTAYTLRIMLSRHAGVPA